MPDSHTGPNGLTTSWQYDGFGRKTLETRPDGTKTAVGYTYCNGVNGGVDGSCPTTTGASGAFLATVTVTGTDGSQIAPSTRSYYDALSRAVAADAQGFDSSWIRTLNIYDSFGRVLKTSRPYFLVGGTPVYTAFTYDAIGRAIKADQPDAGYTTTSYAGLSTTGIVHRVKPDGTSDDLSTTTVKNDLAKVAQVTDANSNITKYTYDAVGDLLTTTDPLGNVIQNWFDVRGRKTKSSDPDMGIWTYQYDSLGRLVSQTDAMQQTTTISYDKLNRMVGRQEPDMTSTWTYGTTSNQATYPNSIDKLVVATCTAGSACPGNGGYTRTHYYDTTGRQWKQTISISGSQNFYSQTTYDAVSGKIGTERSFSGYTTGNVYNAAGYLSQITDNSSGFVVWQANARDAELHLTRSQANNGILALSQSFDQTRALSTPCARATIRRPHIATATSPISATTGTRWVT